MKKILVVDDEPKIVKIISSYLKQKNYKTIIAYTGQEALDSFKQHEPDLIILDLMLPDITGEAILEVLGDLPEDNIHCAFLAAETLQAALDACMREKI